MSYQGFSDGLYLAKQPVVKNGIIVDHYAVIDIGNVLRLKEVFGNHPVVVHQTPPQIRLNWLKDTGRWEVMGKVVDIEGAKSRIAEAFKNPMYDLFGNNCEQFARFVAHNKRYSGQIFWGTVGVIATGFIAYHAVKALRAA